MIRMMPLIPRTLMKMMRGMMIHSGRGAHYHHFLSNLVSGHNEIIVRNFPSLFQKSISQHSSVNSCHIITNITIYHSPGLCNLQNAWSIIQHISLQSSICLLYRWATLIVFFDCHKPWSRWSNVVRYVLAFPTYHFIKPFYTLTQTLCLFRFRFFN